MGTEKARVPDLAQGRVPAAERRRDVGAAFVLGVADVERLMATTLERFGGLDIVFYNAGIGGAIGVSEGARMVRAEMRAPSARWILPLTR